MSDFEPCEVEIRVAVDGVVTPLRVKLGGEWLSVGQVGRTWRDGAGEHWMILPPPFQQTAELRRAPDGLWSVRRVSPSHA